METVAKLSTLPPSTSIVSAERNTAADNGANSEVAASVSSISAVAAANGEMPNNAPRPAAVIVIKRAAGVAPS